MITILFYHTINNRLITVWCKSLIKRFTLRSYMGFFFLISHHNLYGQHREIRDLRHLSKCLIWVPQICLYLSRECLYFLDFFCTDLLKTLFIAKQVLKSDYPDQQPCQRRDYWSRFSLFSKVPDYLHDNKCANELYKPLESYQQSSTYII